MTAPTQQLPEGLPAADGAGTPTDIGGPMGLGTATAPSARRRGPGATALNWSGGILACLIILQGGYQMADRISATTTTTINTYDAAPKVSLVVDGDVSVAIGTEPTVRVETRTRSGFVDGYYSATESATGLTIEATCPVRWLTTGACSNDLVVTVPVGTEAIVRTSYGDVNATGLDATTKLSTGSGDVTVSGVGGDVVANTGSGRIEVSEAAGRVDATSGSGDLTVSGVGGNVVANTGSGRIKVSEAAGRVDATSGDGDVTVSGVGGNVVANTGSGRIEVSGVQGDVDASTSNGDATVWGTGTAVALDISTGNGSTTVEAPTDPNARRAVKIHSSNGDVRYLDAK